MLKMYKYNEIGSGQLHDNRGANTLASYEVSTLI